MSHSKINQPLEAAKETVLLRMITYAGQDSFIAKELLFSGYQWMVHEISQNMFESLQAEGNPLVLQEIIKEGNRGLRKAISMYPTALPASFQRFASLYIENSIERVYQKKAQKNND